MPTHDVLVTSDRCQLQRLVRQERNITSKLENNMQAMRQTSIAYRSFSEGLTSVRIAELYCCKANPPSRKSHIGDMMDLSPTSYRSCKELRARTACRTAGSCCAACRTIRFQNEPSKNPDRCTEVREQKKSKLRLSSSVPTKPGPGFATTRALDPVDGVLWNS